MHKPLTYNIVKLAGNTNTMAASEKIQISVGLWNVGEKACSKDGKEAIKQTLNSIYDYYEQGNAEIILVQEVRSRPVYTALVNNRKALTEYNGKSAQLNSLIIIYEHEKFQAGKRLDIEVPELEDPCRLEVFVVNISDVKCLLASWHGMTRGLTDEEKKERLKHILENLNRAKKKNKCEVCIMGGDFNLEIEKAEEVVKCATGGNVHEYPLPEYRNEKSKGIIDFLVSWPQGKVSKQEIPKPIDVVPQESDRLFPGHKLIWYKLEIAPTSNPSYDKSQKEIDELADELKGVEIRK